MGKTRNFFDVRNGITIEMQKMAMNVLLVFERRIMEREMREKISEGMKNSLFEIR